MSGNDECKSLQLIRARQKHLLDVEQGKAQFQELNYGDFVRSRENAPDMMLIACVEPRLPLANLGMKFGNAVVLRVPGAFVGQRVPGSAEAAAVQVALSKGVKDIVVMGHTDCGAMNCCCNGEGHPDNAFMRDVLDYLLPLKKIRDEIMELVIGKEEKSRRLAEASVRASLDNLENSYPGLHEAVQSGKVRLHGLMLDLEKALHIPPPPFLDELDRKTGKFSPMAGEPAAAVEPEDVHTAGRNPPPFS